MSASDSDLWSGTGPPRDRPGPTSPRRLSRGVGALAGLATGLLALGVAELVAAFTGPSSEPLVAVGDAFVDHTPAWLKNAAVAAFGTHDKQVLLTGAVLVFAGLSALAGVLATRGVGVYVVLAMGAFAGLCAASRPDATVVSVLPSAIAAILGAI
ncbi:MAG: molybdopterin-dependent oxidoreductase, partial [Kineosporiaceae bacterium]